MTTVTTLEARPSLVPIFAKAALRRGSGNAASRSVPEKALRLVGHRVDRGELTAYQRVCGFDVSDVLPHTFPHVLGFPLQALTMSAPDFPMPMMGLVHVENTITVHRVLTADDALDLMVRAENLQPHSKGRTVDLVTEVDVDGERVWEGRSTYLARGKGDAAAASQPARLAPPAMPTGFPVAQWRLPSGLGREYAGVSGDVNPIHMSSITAKAMGFRSAIAHGMWSYARVLAALGTAAQGAATSQVWFRKPILLPGTVELVLDRSREPLIAGLRSARNTEVDHLVLTVSRDTNR